MTRNGLSPTRKNARNAIQSVCLAILATLLLVHKDGGCQYMCCHNCRHKFCWIVSRHLSDSANLPVLRCFRSCWPLLQSIEDREGPKFRESSAEQIRAFHHTLQCAWAIAPVGIQVNSHCSKSDERVIREGVVSRFASWLLGDELDRCAIYWNGHQVSHRVSQNAEVQLHLWLLPPQPRQSRDIRVSSSRFGSRSWGMCILLIINSFTG